MKKITLFYIFGIILFLLVTIGPLLWAFVISITPEYEMFQNTTQVLPTSVTWENYKSLFQWDTHHSIRFFRGLKNSLTAVCMTISICLPIGVISAYILSRMHFFGRKFIRNVLLATMIIPVFATVVPLYRIYAEWNMLNKSIGLALVYTSSLLPIITWLISNYFDTIPTEIEEAAKVDGCNRMHVFFRIILPVSYPIIFSAALILFLNTWNQFQIPLILAAGNKVKPISIIVSEYVTKDSVQYGLTAAAGIIVILPPAAAALIFRKFLISGITEGASKL